MLDVRKQIDYWTAGAVEDSEAAETLLAAGKIRQGLFFHHLSLEKALKAHVCKVTGELAPRLHNLVRLSQLASLEPTQEQLDILADMNAFNLAGRYPDMLGPMPGREEADAYCARAKEMLEWLLKTS